jgi:hypothetical protein
LVRSAGHLIQPFCLVRILRRDRPERDIVEVWRVIGSKIVAHKLCRRIESGQSRGKRVGNRSARRFLAPRAYFNKEDGVHFVSPEDQLLTGLRS